MFPVLGQFHTKSSPVHAKNVVQKVLRRVDAAERDRNVLVRGIKTGFIDLDRMLSGFQPGELIACLSRPSMGKTAFSLSIALNVARQKIPVLCFMLSDSSVEMTTMRLICAMGRVNIYQANTGVLTNEDRSKFVAGVGMVSELPIYIQTSTQTIDHIERTVKEYVLRHQVKFVVIDPLQHIEGVALLSSRERFSACDLIVRRLKAMAKRHNVAVFLTGLLSRRYEDNPNLRRLRSIAHVSREEGNFESNADVVMQLYREDYYDPTPQNLGNATIVLLKTHVNTGSIEIRFDRDHGLNFEDFA